MTDMCNYATARNEMFGLVNDAWVIGAQFAVGASLLPELRFQGKEENAIPARDKYWGRVSTQMVREGEAGVGADEDGMTRRYDAAGLLFVQCFAPMSGDALAWPRLGDLADLALRAVRGKKTASGVWFRNVRRQELAPDGKFQRMNVVAEFQYQERG